MADLKFGEAYNQWVAEGSIGETPGYYATSYKSRKPATTSALTTNRGNASYFGTDLYFNPETNAYYDKNMFADDTKLSTGQLTWDQAKIANPNITSTEYKNIVSSENTAANQGTDWGMEGYGGVALGAGELGLGLASYFQNIDTANKQKELLGQQIANNKAEMANTAARRENISKYFGAPTSGMADSQAIKYNGPLSNAVIDDKFTTTMAEKGASAGPTVENRDLLRSGL